MPLDLDLVEIAQEAAELVMIFPQKHIEFCQIVEKISKYVCAQIYTKLQENNMEWVDSDGSDQESFLSDE